jgi:hypothetical protein
MMKFTRRIAPLFASFAALIVSSAAYASEVCRLSGLQGFEAPAVHAHRLLAHSTTSDPSKTVIYVEKSANGFYYHSNFVTPGYEHSTKIGKEGFTM